MIVVVDNKDVLATVERAQKALRDRLPAGMLAAAKLGAQFERDNKTYQDRTGNLKRNTQGRKVVSNANETVVELVMDEEYASYVRRRGYSKISEAGVRTRDQIQDLIDDIAVGVTG